MIKAVAALYNLDVSREIAVSITTTKIKLKRCQTKVPEITIELTEWLTA